MEGKKGKLSTTKTLTSKNFKLKNSHEEYFEFFNHPFVQNKSILKKVSIKALVQVPRVAQALLKSGGG